MPQEKTPAVFSLSGTVAPPTDLANWHEVGLDLDLSLSNFLPQPVVQQYFGKSEMKAAGQLSVSLKAKGSPATGVKLNGQVEGKDFSFAFPSYYRNPFPVRNLDFAFTWAAMEDRQRFEDLSLKIDDLQISGNLALSRKNNSPWLEGTLSSSAISADRLLGFLPDRKATSPAVGLRDHILGGTLTLETASLDGPVSAFAHFDSSFPLREAKISLAGGTIRVSPNTLLKEIVASLTLTGNRITIKGGSAHLAGSPLRFSGSVDRLYQPDKALQLETEGTLPATNLMALLPTKSPDNLTLGGNVPLKLKVVGTRDDLQANLSANLNDLSFQLGKIVSKAAGRKGSLSLSGEVTPQTLTLQRGRLQLPFLDVSANGALARTGDRSFKLAFDAPQLDLLKIRTRVPVLKKFKARGGLSLHYALAGANGRINNRQGKILLHDFGIHVVRTIADINHANGKILLSGDRADLTDIALKMGSSTLNVRGTIRDFTDPKFDLRVRGNAVHGEDLTFFSTDAVLRDLKAHLTIDRSHIAFEPAPVKLDGGTDATVRGTISNFKAPKVRLDIESQHANIDEVIGLWHKPRPPEKVQGPERKTFVHITARVREGTLGELHFQNAEGVITSQQKVLTIHPLHFHAGKGFCTGQVVVDHTSGSPPLLKISGHLENFDAAAIYRDLLKRRGLVTGTLKGDFYLEGKAGKEFLPTSLGGFNMEVEKGVLRKFQFLSKVFSLLNVSQILTFQLPDMSLEGMPFNKLKGSFSLRQGVLTTEDLL
ncbi:MAG: AsmA-like C-terminal region-containing protein, partial [Desulfuromonadales bacterium]